MFSFQNATNVIIAIASFAIGIVIAITNGLGSAAVRGYLGDVIVVIFLIALLRILRASEHTAVICVLVLACAIELLQLVDLPINAPILLGTSFDPLDIVAYLLGAIIYLISFRTLEAIRKQKITG